MDQPLSQPSNEQIIATIDDELPVGVWVARAPGGEFVFANRAFREIMGMEARDDVAVGEYAQPYGIHGRNGAPYPEHQMPFVRALQARTTVVVDDIVIHRSDGRRVYIRATAKPVFDANDAITHVVIAFIDISREVDSEHARVESETRLKRAQRAESIGVLAGGIAHDFNNMLAVIRLLSGALRRTERDPVRLEDLRRIEDVTESAAKLTRAMLGFAGRGKNRAESVSVNALARALMEIFEHTIDKRIEMSADLRADPGETIGDLSQIEQLLMNLVLNARDAVAEQGRIEIRTYNVQIGADSRSSALNLAPGPHLVLEVADTGAGIDPA